MHLDNLIDDLGGFGRYQIVLVIIANLARAVSVPSMLTMGFAAFEPDWWCEARDSNPDQSNVSLFNGSFKNCNWNGTCERIFSDSMETVVSQWNLVCNLFWIPNAITSVQMGGLLIGGLISGYMADSYGRKKTLYSGLLMLFIANVITVFSVSWIMFTILRAVTGIALGLILSTLYLYQMEFVGRRWRVFTAAIPSWEVGMILQSLLSQWLHHWKWLHLAYAAIVAPLLPTYFFLDESLRWLTVKGHLKQARRVVHNMATMNRKPVPDTSILELIAEDERAEGDKAKNYNYSDLFKTKAIATKTVVTCFAWGSFSHIYYGIYFGVKNLSGDLYLNMLFMALTELPLSAIVIIITAICGRRTATTSVLLLTSGVCFGLAVCTRHAPLEERGTYINVLANTAKLAVSVSWVIMIVLGVEQFPTVIRNQAFAAQNTGARIGGVFASQVLTLGGSDDLMAPFIAMGILAFITALGCLLLEETRGKPLQDTMKSFAVGIPEQDVALEALNTDGVLQSEKKATSMEHDCTT